MRKLLAFILLLSHINFSMFIAQVDEVDVYDKTGCQLADINTLGEFIDAAVNGTQNTPSQDEDDDNARYFHIDKVVNHTFQQQIAEVKKSYTIAKEKINYPPYIQNKLALVCFDIQSPPPEA